MRHTLQPRPYVILRDRARPKEFSRVDFHGRCRQYLPKIRHQSQALVPVSWISPGNFFETHAISNMASRYMQMTIDYGERVEAYVPIFGVPGATPQRKARNVFEVDEVIL